MEIVCLGLSHHTAPVEIREKFAVPEHEIARSALELSHQPGLGEAVIVSTCNRVEFYVATEDAREAFEVLSRFIAARAGEPSGSAFFRHASQRSVQHLFRVVSGLDSMVLGETEILGQVKKAYQAAQQAGATGRHLNKLFQRAFNVAKEVRTNTNITRGSVSVGSVAVELAEKIFGRLGDCHVMILGAGETSEMTAGALQARGVKAIFVANRSHERAVALAEKMGGKAIHFDEWAADFHVVDILIGSTAAPHPVVTREKLLPLMRTRQDRPLFCIDLAVPRDFEAAVNNLEGVYLYDIDSLQQIADSSMAVRQQEVAVCHQLIERHVTEFSEWLAAGPRPPAGPLHSQPEGAKP
jgi:glutamyl-tRNA reductase